MHRKHLIAFLSILIFLSCNKSSNSYVIDGLTMGTTYSIEIIESNAIDLPLIKSDIERILDLINMDMSTYIDSSSISKFNNLDIGIKYSISDDFDKVIRSSKYFYDITDGAFDVTVNRLVELWGFSKESVDRIPSQNEINLILQSIGMKNLTILESKEIIKKKDFTIDLSAIAKGYAVDKISRYLNDKNMQNHMIDIGGEITTSGFNSSGDKWVIGIQYPNFQRSINKFQYSESNPYTLIKISDVSIATSGDYRNYYDFNGTRYSHIISPKTGYPIQNNISSVSVLSKKCLNADALATALMVMNVDNGIKLTESLDGYESFYILKDNTMRYSSGFKDYLN